MPFYDREDKILTLLSSCEEMSLKELSKRLYISLPTLRRDLIKLENKGLIQRMHGKASFKKNSSNTEISFTLRTEEQSTAKNIIAKKALEHIKDGDVIMLDGSTSAYCMVPFLTKFKNLIVITSGAKTSILLAHYGITNICTGGNMLNRCFSYVGIDALQSIENYNADVLFFSCRGISLDGKLTDNSIEVNLVRQQMIKHSKKRIFLCDSSKINKTYLNNLCNISDIDTIISENELPPELHNE